MYFFTLKLISLSRITIFANHFAAAPNRNQHLKFIQSDFVFASCLLSEMENEFGEIFVRNVEIVESFQLSLLKFHEYSRSFLPLKLFTDEKKSFY